MLITQSDVAQLTDVQVKRLALELNVASNTQGGPLGGFYRAVSVALVRVMRERRIALAVVEMDVINGDGPGALVEDGDDPVAEALEELRAGGGWWEVDL